MIYGCKNGSIGAIELTKEEAITLWELEGEGSVSLLCCDSLKEQNICLVRENGEIELFAYKEN